MVEFDEIFQASEQKCDFKIKQDIIKELKSNVSSFCSPARARLD